MILNLKISSWLEMLFVFHEANKYYAKELACRSMFFKGSLSFLVFDLELVESMKLVELLSTVGRIFNHSKNYQLENIKV